MSNSRLSLIFIFFCLVTLTLGQSSQTLTFYTERDGRGSPFQVYEPYVAQLGLPGINFDGRARSACVTGMWLIYDLPFYNSAKNAPMQYHYGANNYCVNLEEMEGKVSSVRSAGNFLNIRDETITLYEGNYMQGIEEYIYGDIRSINLDRRVSSAIITGRSSWTLYDGPNFTDQGRGNSVCVTPKNLDRPSIITDTSSIRLSKAIRSIKKGCTGNIRTVYI